MTKWMLAFVFSLSSTVFAQDIALTDFDNWILPDIAKQGVTKEQLFSSMNRETIKRSSSVCSNRAHVWAYDFLRFHKVESGKIFLFYTQKGRSDIGSDKWWYHVSPMVNEGGKIWVLDAGFGMIKSALTKDQWLEKFTKTNKCKYINAQDEDLLKRMFRKSIWPKTTKHGTWDCYYIYSPYTYWVPSAFPKRLLGIDADGKPVNYRRDEMDRNELFTACEEAVTTGMGRKLGTGKKICSEYL